MPHPGLFKLLCCCGQPAGPFCGCAIGASCRLLACDGFSTAFPLAATLAVSGSSQDVTWIGDGGADGGDGTHPVPAIANIPSSYTPAAGGGSITIDTLAKARTYATDPNGASAVEYAISGGWTGGTLTLGPDDARTLGPYNGGCLAQAIGYYRRYLLPNGDEYVFDGLMDGMPRFSATITGTLYKNAKDAGTSTLTNLAQWDWEAEHSFHPFEDTRYVVKAWAQPTGASDYTDAGGEDETIRTGLAAIELYGFVSVGLAMETRSRAVYKYFTDTRTATYDNWTVAGPALGLICTPGLQNYFGLFGFNAAAYNAIEHTCCKTESLPTAWGDATGSGFDQFLQPTAVTLRPATVSSASIAKATPSDPGCQSAPRWIRVVLEWGNPATETYRVEMIMRQGCVAAATSPTYQWPTSCAWGVYRIVSSTLTSAGYGTEDWTPPELSLYRVSPILWVIEDGARDGDGPSEWFGAESVFARYIKHASTSPVGMTDIERFPVPVDVGSTTQKFYGDGVLKAQESFSYFKALYLVPCTITVTETTPESDLGCACDCPDEVTITLDDADPILLEQTSTTPCTYEGEGASVEWDEEDGVWRATHGATTGTRTGGPRGDFTNGIHVD